MTVLSQHQYCVVLNPLGDDGRPRLGCRELRQGPRTFFLHPGNPFIQACIAAQIVGHALPYVAMHVQCTKLITLKIKKTKHQLLLTKTITAMGIIMHTCSPEFTCTNELLVTRNDMVNV